MKERRFTKEGSIAERRERYEARSNPLTTFLKQYKADPDSFIPANDFYDDFSAFLRQNGFRSLSYNTVRGMVRDEGFEYERHRYVGYDNPISCLVGLKRSHNKAESVSSVPAVSALSIYPPIYVNQGKSASTADTADTKNNVFDELCELFKGKTGKVIPIEIILKKIPSISEEWIEDAKQKGKVFENPAGFYGLL